MILDNEAQRQNLLAMVNAVPIASAALPEMRKQVEALTDLEAAIKEASVATEDDLK